MFYYCLCEAAHNTPDGQVIGAPNRYCAAQGNDDFPPLALHQAMRCIKTGARQVILNHHQPNGWAHERPTQYRPHYPSVDVFECPHCRARMVREE